MSAAPRSDADRALAVGYASHLVSDVVAHNDFVPEHEARIARVQHVTHAIAEFALDQHVRASLRLSPGAALQGERALVAEFVAHAFRCSEPMAERALAFLVRADDTLRASPLPRLCRRAVARVQRRLADIELALAGGFTDWVSSDPEGRAGDRAADQRARGYVARVMQTEHDAGRRR